MKAWWMFMILMRCWFAHAFQPQSTCSSNGELNCDTFSVTSFLVVAFFFFKLVNNDKKVIKDNKKQCRLVDSLTFS